MLGPVIGQLIYNFVGYEKTFYIIAGILGAPLALCIVFIP